MVCGPGRWQCVSVEKGGKTAAVLPYFQKSLYGLHTITMPTFARFMGPWLHPDFERPGQEIKLMAALIDRLPKTHKHVQHLHYRRQNWLPYYWAGFRQTTCYSYRLRNLQDLDQTYRGLSTDYRNNKLRKATENLSLQLEAKPEMLYRLAAASYQRQSLRPPFSQSLIRQLAFAASQHNAGRLFCAVDAHGRPHSAAFLLWDAQSSYLLVAGDDPQFRHSGAGIFLTWELIRFTSRQLGLSQFDFLGSMHPRIERVRRQFGAERVPYFTVYRYAPAWLEALEIVLKRRPG